ncbi:MAG: HNH endonuclease [Treponema sp.]|nr:HNH endonuclease [Treponema sp.]
MASHRNDTEITEIKKYFTSVIDWIDRTFKSVDSTMCGLEWGRLYEEYKKKPFDINKLDDRIKELLADWSITDKKGIYEFVLSGEVLEKRPFLNIRLFDKSVIKSVYTKQTNDAQKNGVSNCPMCTEAGGANKNRIYKENEMDADHATAWSKGGATDISNCVMLCKNHNRSKGNR